jgi:hypothetical protein
MGEQRLHFLTQSRIRSTRAFQKRGALGCATLQRRVIEFLEPSYALSIHGSFSPAWFPLAFARKASQ